MATTSNTNPFEAPLAYQNSTINSLLNQLEYQKKILLLIKALLPEPLAQHALHGLIKDHSLIIYTDAAIWATQLRFYNQALLNDLTTAYSKPLKELKIKLISEPTGVIFNSLSKPVIPSIEAIERMQTDIMVISDESLKLALTKLNTTLKKHVR